MVQHVAPVVESTTQIDPTHSPVEPITSQVPVMEEPAIVTSPPQPPPVQEEPMIQGPVLETVQEMQVDIPTTQQEHVKEEPTP